MIVFDTHNINANSLHFVSPGQIHALNRGAGVTGYVVIFSKEFMYLNTSDNMVNVFKPEVTDVYDYSLLVYDRLGAKIFETSNFEQGWDGYYKGELCKQDVYVYKIVFFDSARKDYHSYDGKITLLR